MQQYNIKNIIETGAKVAVACEEKETANKVIDIMELPFAATKNIFYSSLDGFICISLMGHGIIGDFIASGYIIIPASLFLYHNLPEAEKKPFVVKADTFELYENFVQECDAMGWKQSGEHLIFDMVTNKNVIAFGHSALEDNLNKKFVVNYCWDVSGDNHDIEHSRLFHLETQYPEAIAAAKAWFPDEEKEVKMASKNMTPLEEVMHWKELHDAVLSENKRLKTSYDTMSKEAQRLQSIVYDLNNQLSNLKSENTRLTKFNAAQSDRNNAKLTAISILLSTFHHNRSHRQKQFAVDCIKSHIEEMLEKSYDDGGLDLPF